MLDQGDMKSWSFWGMFMRSMFVLCWVGPVMFLSSYAVENASLMLLILCFLAIFVPTTAGMFYVGTVNKIERLQSLREVANSDIFFLENFNRNSRFPGLRLCRLHVGVLVFHS